MIRRAADRRKSCAVIWTKTCYSPSATVRRAIRAIGQCSRTPRTHGDFIDFVRAFARQHPSSRTTTELLFLLDELAQGSRDVLLTLLDLARELQLHYSAWLGSQRSVSVGHEGHDVTNNNTQRVSYLRVFVPFVTHAVELLH